jgi:hypothetical protein
MIKFEKTLNFIVAIFLLTNLYFLNNLVSIPRNLIIVSLLVISFLFFLKNFSTKLLSLLGFQLVVSYVVLSFILFILNLLLFDYEINGNDIIRVVGYMFFFCWTFSLYKSDEISFNRYLAKLCTTLLIIIVIISFFEYYFYFAFWSLINGEAIDWEGDVRLAGTFMDPNSFASALSVYLFIYLRLKGFGLKGWAYLLISLFLINLSGSRLGLVLVVVILVPQLTKIDVNLAFLKKVFFLISCLALTLLVYFNSFKIESDDDYTAVSTFDRIFNEEKKVKSDASSNERLQSIDDALATINFSNLVLPPGSLYFKSKWEKEVNVRHFPHSSFLYLLVEYGVYVIWQLIIILLVYMKSRKSKTTTLFFLLFFQFLLLPNAMYYPTIFLIIFYIEINYEYSRNTTIAKE